MQANEADRHRNVHSQRTAPFAVTAIAFAAGIACTGAAIWWVGSRDREQARSSAVPAEPVSEARPAPLIEAPVVIINKSEKTPASAPNPFQRLPAGTPLPVSRRQYAAPAPAPKGASETYAWPQEPMVSLQWVQELRASCAQRAGKEKSDCERLADALERLVAKPDHRDPVWEREMQASLLELFEASARSADFSLHEVACDAHACVLYWHSRDYADWRGAGSALLDDLRQRPWSTQFNVRGLRRIGEFDPLTSTPWEMIVLERKVAKGEQKQ